MLDKLSAVSFVANPYPYYHQVRSADPIHWNPAIRSWTVTSYTHVLHALRHQHLSSQRPKPDLDHLSKSSRQIADAFYDTLSSWLLHSDPPHHTRLRQLAAQSFSKPLLERMQGEAHRTAQHLMNIVEPLGRIEVISDFAAPLSLSVISHLIGIPSQDRTRFARWLDEIGAAAEAAADATKLALGHASLLKAVDYLRNLISRRLQQPQLDLLSSFLSTEFSADRLAEQEVISIILLLLMAGRDTATHALGNGVLNLLKNPEQLERLRRDKSLSTNAVQELVRYDTPLQGLLR